MTTALPRTTHPCTARPRTARLVAASGLVGLLVLAGCGTGPVKPAAVTPGAVTPDAVSADAGGKTGIVVDAVGKVQGTPDTVTVSLAVQTSAPKAADALNTNSQKTAALLKILKDGGAADKDLTTSGLSLNPDYDQYPHVRGYQATNQVTATLHDLAKAGALIDQAVAGTGDAARLQGVGFSIADTSDLVTEARKRAVGEAKAKATTLAEAAGIKLGSVRTITEAVDRPNPITYGYGTASSGAGALADRAAVPLQPGQQDLSVTVTIVYDLG